MLITADDMLITRVLSSEKLKMLSQKPSHLKGHYNNICTAQKLVDGTGRPSIESDVYSLDYLINTVAGL